MLGKTSLSLERDYHRSNRKKSWGERVQREGQSGNLLHRGVNNCQRGGWESCLGLATGGFVPRKVGKKNGRKKSGLLKCNGGKKIRERS